MSTIEQKIEIMQAHKEGKTVQFRHNSSLGTWGVVKNPRWNWHYYDYRILQGSAETYITVLRNHDTQEIIIEDSGMDFFPRGHEILGTVNVQVTLDDVDLISVDTTVD